MKTQYTNTLMVLLLTLCLVFNLPAQPSSPPPTPPGHGQNGNQGGGNAPIGEGLLLLLALSGGYGIFKASRITSKDKKG
jgi:hypothetical protein